MSADAASAKTNLVEPSAPLASPMAIPTGYRVAIVPGAVEVSARLGCPEEIRDLVKVLRGSILAIEDTTDGDMDAPLNLTKPAERIGERERGPQLTTKRENSAG